MNTKDKKLPKTGTKRFGHRSHVKWDRFVKIIGKANFFEQLEESEKKKYGTNVSQANQKAQG